VSEPALDHARVVREAAMALREGEVAGVTLITSRD
jgi:hypothetical protein